MLPLPTLVTSSGVPLLITKASGKAPPGCVVTPTVKPICVHVGAETGKNVWSAGAGFEP